MQVAALQRPALRMDQTKAEEVLTALRRVAQAWAESQRQSLAWRPNGPAVLWVTPVAMSSPIAFVTAGTRDDLVKAAPSGLGMTAKVARRSGR